MDANLRHVIRRKAVNGAHHDGQQRNVLHRVVDNLQQRQGNAHLIRFEKTSGCVGPCRDAKSIQFTDIIMRGAVGAAQQHAEIAVICGTQRSVLRDARPAVHHAVNQLRNPAAFRRNHIAVFFSAAGKVNDVQPRGRFLRRRIGSARNKLFFRRIIEFARLAAHQLAEHEVDRVRDAGTAAKVAPEHHTGGVSIRFPIVKWKARPFFQKNLRHGLPESVDALLHVSDKKQVPAVF